MKRDLRSLLVLQRGMRALELLGQGYRIKELIPMLFSCRDSVDRSLAHAKEHLSTRKEDK